MCLVHVFETVVASISKMMAVKKNEIPALLVAVTHCELFLPHMTPLAGFHLLGALMANIVVSYAVAV